MPFFFLVYVLGGAAGCLTFFIFIIFMCIVEQSRVEQFKVRNCPDISLA